MLKKILLVIIFIISLAFSTYAMTISEYNNCCEEFFNDLNSMNNSSNLPSELKAQFADEIYKYKDDCNSKALLWQLQGTVEQFCTIEIAQKKYNELKIRLGQWINLYSNNVINKSKNNENVKETKKKPVGHANVGGKIWNAGDSLDILNDGTESNPLNTTIIQAENSNPDELYVDFVDKGSFRAPKDFAINNGIIHFKSAKHGVNKDDVDGTVQDYIAITYIAEIFDSKTDGLKFNFVRNGHEIISENVNAYDYEYTTYIYKVGNITVSE